MKCSPRSAGLDIGKDGAVYETACRKFRDVFGRPHSTAAYAPGRIEVLGNHTDYNEGFVLSAAVDLGTFFLLSEAEGTTCRCVAGDIMEGADFEAGAPHPVGEPAWLNYITGTMAGLLTLLDDKPRRAFDALFLGNIPLGAGLSSSAALEMSGGLALAAFYGVDTDKLDLARIGQAAEHAFAGVKCGLLDQITSLFGKRRHLVMTDFRTLEVETVPAPADICFLTCNTRARHALVDGEYNRRREQCEAAACFFDSRLDHPVSALRDVSVEEWNRHHGGMDNETARRALHPIGENERVVLARSLLKQGAMEDLGRLMFDSHASSRTNFENSCSELDFLVDTAAEIPGILGAKLSGGGFGGSAVMLVGRSEAERAGAAVVAAYARQFGYACDVRVVVPSDGAQVL